MSYLLLVSNTTRSCCNRGHNEAGWQGKGCKGVRVWGCRGREETSIPNAQCPMPYAPCPIPHALCPKFTTVHKHQHSSRTEA
ncbi:hypothetical protein CV014_24060 [Nostoc sp. CMAA1605]|nr:hypothetical protein [Nostoc sp. CMAA1605]